MNKEKTAKPKAKNYSISSLIQDPVQLVFALLALATLIMLFPFTYASYQFIQEKKANAPKGYIFPSISDMKITLVSSVIFAILEISMRKLFYFIFIPFCKEQNDVKIRHLKSEKGAFCMFKVVYFAWASGWGYYVLKDTYYLPPALGGRGDLSISFKEFPYANHVPQLKEYLLITMGYHVGGLFTHFFGTRRNDFLEMGLHHIVSIYLFGGCYLLNVWECGSVIALLHDIADITTNVTKFLAESRFKIPLVIVFLVHMCIWFYTRNFLLPQYIYFIWNIENVHFNHPLIQPFFCYLLGCMFMLHCFWFYLFCKMLYRFAKVGATDDIQNKIEADKPESTQKNKSS